MYLCAVLKQSVSFILSDLHHRSPGYGITLIAESTTEVMYAGEAHWLASDNKLSTVLPEDLGAQAVSSLIEEIVKVHVEQLSMLCL